MVSPVIVMNLIARVVLVVVLVLVAMVILVVEGGERAHLVKAHGWLPLGEGYESCHCHNI